MGGKEKRKKGRFSKNRLFLFSERNLYEIKTKIYFLSRVLMILLRSHPEMYPKIFREKYGRKKRRIVSFQKTIKNGVFVFPK